MKSYEVVYILDATLSPTAVEAKLARFHAALGGEVTAEDHWGVRRLAYPIGAARTGYYAIAHVTVDPVGLPEFERLLRLDEETIRYLVVRDEGQPTSGASVLAERPGFAGRAAAAENGADASAAGEGEARAEGEGAAPGDAARDAEGAEAPEAGPDAEAAGEEDEAEADEAGSAADASETPQGEAADEGDAAAAATEDGEPEADEADAEAPRPSSGPPEFSGARGRRRRHEGPPIELLNYKDVTTLARFLTEQGKILPKRTTKVSARFQRSLGTAVKRARFVALLPYVKDHEG